MARQRRPTADNVERWTAEMAGSPAKVERAARILESLLDADLAAWGYSRGELRAQLRSVPLDGEGRRRAGGGRYALERRVLVLLRRNIHRNAFGRWVRRLRDACDVLLR